MGDQKKRIWRKSGRKRWKQFLKLKGLSCELKWDKGEMTVSTTRRTDNRLDNDIVCRGGRALYVLACGLSTQWVYSLHILSHSILILTMWLYMFIYMFIVTASCCSVCITHVVLLFLLFPTWTLLFSTVCLSHWLHNIAGWTNLLWGNLFCCH